MNDIEAHVIEMKKRAKKFSYVLTLMLSLVIALEILRMFVLDAKVNSLVKRLHACEVAKGVMIPLDEPYNVAEESDHGD